LALTPLKGSDQLRAHGFIAVTSTEAGRALLQLTESYLRGQTSFWDLYRLAADVVPSVIDTDPEATELAGAIMAAEAEVVEDDLAALARGRREMVKEAMPRSVR
jgi:hypothetical protein